jgi:asparagine synthase (glutamine-hydrolysing)
MCGITGLVQGLGYDSSETRFRLKRSLDNLSRRGPDDQGIEDFEFHACRVKLGHTRLSIQDLTEAGHQPMKSLNGRYVIVFNGEIYNFVELRNTLKQMGYNFVSKTDTEVLLVAWEHWGKQCLTMLKGMFAFAIVDRKRQLLTCVRDGYGIKPLYYSKDRQGFYFASELRATTSLMKEAPRPDLQWTLDYLVGGVYDNSERTALEGISALLPGHLIEVDCSKPWHSSSITGQECWWRPEIVESYDRGFEEAANELRERLLTSVRMHLRSDVPVGAALSGGLDSSAVVCAMRELGPEMDLHTFTFVAPGSSVDEEEWADMINTKTNATSQKVIVEEGDLARDLPELIAAQGEPFGTTSIYAQYRVFKAAKEAGIKVMLEGQGADELLGGYNGYPVAKLRSLINQKDISRVIKFVDGWSKGPGRGRRKALAALAMSMLPADLMIEARRIQSQVTMPRWINHQWLKENGLSPNLILPSGMPPQDTGEHNQGRQLVGALRHTLIGGNLQQLLRHSDRNSMHWSIESRVPFLTNDLAEYCLGLPERYLVSDSGTTKALLRAAVKGLVAEEIRNRKDKVGFATPELTWLKQIGTLGLEWHEMSHCIPFLKQSAVRDTFNKELSNQKSHTSSTWRIVNLCGWLHTLN